LRETQPEIPSQLDGRAADGWEPLLAIAAQAGNDWRGLAQSAAVALSTGAAREEDSPQVKLLQDTRRVFDERASKRLRTTNLIAGLCEDETAPWSDWHGKRITPQALARLLRPFGIRPETLRYGIGTEPDKGYRREAFESAWARYLPSDAPYAASGSVTLSEVNSPNPLMDAARYGVTDNPPILEKEGPIAPEGEPPPDDGPASGQPTNRTVLGADSAPEPRVTEPGPARPAAVPEPAILTPPETPARLPVGTPVEVANQGIFEIESVQPDGYMVRTPTMGAFAKGRKGRASQAIFRERSGRNAHRAGTASPGYSVPSKPAPGQDCCGWR
jgi:hypothetical protein